MNRPFIFITSLFLSGMILSCRNEAHLPGSKASGHQIVLVPFKGADTGIVNEVQTRLRKRLNAEIRIAQQVYLPSSAYYEKRRRYVADSLLVFLKKYSNSRSEKVLGISAHDISTKKGQHANYGIMGLGYCPGESCVISSFRVKRSSRNKEHFTRRMTVLALHELGHTYSLPHCKNDPCLMRDAEGKMNLDNGESYCDDCSFYLRLRGILK